MKIRRQSLIVIAVAAVALLSAGALLGDVMSSHAGRPEAAKTAGPAVAQPPVESWYFPAQYVNQGKENEQQPWEF
jgi:hypothetical protein